MNQSDDCTVWELPVGGFQVYEVAFGGRIAITVFGRRPESERFAPSTTLSIGGRFHYVDGDGLRHALNAEEPWETMTLLFGLRHRIVVSAVADNRSRIEILFDDGSTLDAEPGEQFENWEIVGPDGINLVGMPNGGDPRISGTDGLHVAGT